MLHLWKKKNHFLCFVKLHWRTDVQNHFLLSERVKYSRPQNRQTSAHVISRTFSQRSLWTGSQGSARWELHHKPYDGEDMIRLYSASDWISLLSQLPFKLNYLNDDVSYFISFSFIYLFVQGPHTLINPWVNVLTLAKDKFQLWSLWPDVTAFTKGERG